ncbi:MAG: ChaN family lipoprotein [Bacteroidota bacterium]|nr:ChaN family lipoprotein [Bacteroidota bacterium]
MKKQFYILILSFCSVLSVFSQELKSYQIFNSKGKKITYAKMTKELQKYEVILFGELHNEPIAHWLQIKIVKDFHKAKHHFAIGLEMMERDVQPYLDDYLKGDITQKQFDSLGRLWHNYTTDYKPIVDYAKENKISVIASNIPRRYARKVYKYGLEALDSLPDADKKWIAPLPIKYDSELSQYKNMLKMNVHAGENFPKAQAIKDATMGYSIVEQLENNQKIIHLHGAYHSDFYQGIYWYVKQQRPEVKIAVISTVLQEQLQSIDKDSLKKADFIIVIDQDMTKTY